MINGVASSNLHYVWSNGVSGTAKQDSLAAGLYAVTVTDLVNSCSRFAIANVQDASFTIDHGTVTPVSCHNAQDGAITLDLAGMGSVNVFWSNGHSGPSINELKAGTYFAQVTNSVGCVAYKSFTLSNPEPIVIEDSVALGACNTSDHQIYLNVTGGSGTFDQFRWSDDPLTNYSQPKGLGVPAGFLQRHRYRYYWL
jgi:hypothetical protein